MRPDAEHGPAVPARSARPPIPGPIGRGLARLYGVVIARRNRRFDDGRGVIRFDRPVISVGNLSVGGTGKTPMVTHIVGLLVESGHRPCIAMRGYGAEGAGGSDEAAAYRREFPAVPIVARPDRSQGLMELFGEQYEADDPGSDCIVLDDGFQHRRIARDLDIVLIDATRPLFEDRLLPAGWLREPVESLARAGMVVITHAESAGVGVVEELGRKIARARAGVGAECVARHAWAGMSVVEHGVESRRGTDWLRGRRVFALCAIGNPRPFLAAAAAHSGSPLAGELVLRDHDPFAPGTILRAIEGARRAGAEAILTTEKDWSKLARVSPGQWPCAVARPELVLEFERGGEALAGRVLQIARQHAPPTAPPDDAATGAEGR